MGLIASAEAPADESNVDRSDVGASGTADGVDKTSNKDAAGAAAFQVCSCAECTLEHRRSEPRHRRIRRKRRRSHKRLLATVECRGCSVRLAEKSESRPRVFCRSCDDMTKHKVYAKLSLLVCTGCGVRRRIRYARCRACTLKKCCWWTPWDEKKEPQCCACDGAHYGENCPKLPCFHCGEDGHVQFDCTKRSKCPCGNCADSNPKPAAAAAVVTAAAEPPAR
jgi:hypothetical protein